MARTEADLTIFMLASDYNPAHYVWTENEISALGNCKSTVAVIKRRLEDNGAKVKEMYVIEHKGEKKADSESEQFHGATDETKPHYHILVRFEPSHKATLKEIAKYIGVPMQIIVKPKRGGYSYKNNLAYLTHIKYENKIQYVPEDVVTLAGTDYMDYYNENKEKWLKGRAIVAKKGGKTLDRLFREAVSKLKSGELFYRELAGVPKYRELLFNAKYQSKLEAAGKRVAKVAELDLFRLCDRLANNEISKEEAKTCKEYNLVFKYYSDSYIDSCISLVKHNRNNIYN